MRFLESRIWVVLQKWVFGVFYGFWWWWLREWRIRIGGWVVVGLEMGFCGFG